MWSILLIFAGALLGKIAAGHPAASVSNQSSSSTQPTTKLTQLEKDGQQILSELGIGI